MSINVVLDKKLPDIQGKKSLLTWNDGGNIVDDKKLCSYLIFVKPREVQVKSHKYNHFTLYSIIIIIPPESHAWGTSYGQESAPQIAEFLQ